MKNRRARLSAFLTRHSRLIALALLSGALLFGGLLRLGAAHVNDGVEVFWQNDWEYYGIGVQLAETGQFRPYPGWVPTAFRMPLYPAAISLVRQVKPGIAGLRSAQAFLDWIAIAAVYAAAAALGGGICGGLAAAFYALCGLPIGQVSLPQIESLFGVLLILFVCAWIRCVRRRANERSPLLPAALLGLALSCRSTLFLLPFLLAWIFPVDGWKARGRTAAVLVLGSYLFLLPWAARNAAVFRSFIPFENGAASINLWGSSVGILDNPMITQLLGSPQHKEFLERAQQAGDLERPRIYREETLKNILRRPAPFLLNFLRRLPILWREQWFFLLLALPFFWQRPLPRGSEIIILTLAYFNIHALMGVTPRYARPILGVSCVAAALGLRALLPWGPEPNRPLAWPWRAATAAGAILTVVYLVAMTQLIGEAWRWRKGLTYLPTEYLDSHRHYDALKHGNAAGVNLAFQGRMREAESAFSTVLQREPFFGESLIGRAMVRDFQAERNGAAQDYRTLLLNLEFPKRHPLPQDAESRLNQF
ncbi:MAG: hypothetical protein AAB268_10715 [Elusimicrobiota bacterium]